MNRYGMTALVMGLALGGLPGCAALQQLGGPVGQIAKEQAAASERIDALKKDCDGLKARSISFEEESAFGGAVSVNWVSQGGGLTSRPDARALHVQLNKIGRNLAAQSSRPDLPWTFGVLQSEGVNAVSGPGGYVFVSEGLLASLDNEAQLAGVLAHEIAHITHKHALREYQAYLVDQCEATARAERAQAVVGSAKTLGNAVLGPSQVLPPGELRNLFDQLAHQVDFNFDKLSAQAIQAITNGYVARLTEKGFGEADEYDADADAVELMAAAGYSPEEYVAFLSKLPDKGLSTAHPSKGKRQERLRKQLAELRAGAPAGEFTTSVDLTQTKVVPLRDALQTRRVGVAAHTN